MLLRYEREFMKRFFSALATLFLLGIAVPAAVASPIFTYGFNVTSYDCYRPDCSDQSFYRQKLESMTISLTLQAVGDGDATLHYRTLDWRPGGVPPTYIVSDTNQGIASVGLNAWGVALDLENGICQSSWLCNVEADLDVSVFLRGLFRLDTSNDNVYMTTSNSNQWAGYIHSDGPYMTYSPGGFPTFTGEWLLVRVVPEPGTIVLFAISLAGLVFSLRRKAV